MAINRPSLYAAFGDKESRVAGSDRPPACPLTVGGIPLDWQAIQPDRA
jgi:hypothetical protein